MSTPTVYGARSHLAVLHRRKTATIAELEAAQSSLAEANIAAAVQRNLSKAPPLSGEAVARLTALLNGGAS